MRRWSGFWILVGIVLLGGCSHNRDEQPNVQPTGTGGGRPRGGPVAVAVLNPTQGNNVRGTVTFTPTAAGTRITADVRGLAPNSVHGFHIHEYGDARAADATSAGGHYAPEGNRHGGPNSPEHHAGDLGNIRADSQGRARADMVVDYLSVQDRHPVLGRAVIVHEKEDDLTSQPTGAAGSRLAIGIVGLANPDTPRE